MMFKLRLVTFHSPPLRSGDVSISSIQIRRRGSGFAISLLSSSLQWRCGGGFCSGSVLVWIGDREFGFLWVCWIFVGFGLCFQFWVFCGWLVLVLLMGLWVLLVVGGSRFVSFVDVVALLVVDGSLGFAGGRWSQGLWVLLVVSGWWLLAFCGFCWVRSLALWVLFFNFFFFSKLEKGKRKDLGEW